MGRKGHAIAAIMAIWPDTLWPYILLLVNGETYQWLDLFSYFSWLIICPVVLFEKRDTQMENGDTLKKI